MISRPFQPARRGPRTDTGRTTGSAAQSMIASITRARGAGIDSPKSARYAARLNRSVISAIRMKVVCWRVIEFSSNALATVKQMAKFADMLPKIFPILRTPLLHPTGIGNVFKRMFYIRG